MPIATCTNRWLETRRSWTPTRHQAKFRGEHRPWSPRRAQRRQAFRIRSHGFEPRLETDADFAEAMNEVGVAPRDVYPTEQGLCDIRLVRRPVQPLPVRMPRRSHRCMRILPRRGCCLWTKRTYILQTLSLFCKWSAYSGCGCRFESYVTVQGLLQHTILESASDLTGPYLRAYQRIYNTLQVQDDTKDVASPAVLSLGNELDVGAGTSTSAFSC